MTETGRNHLAEILTALAERGVDFVVCGGVAAALHGVERMTLDVDLSVDFSPENMRKFLEAMKALDLKPRVPVPGEVLLDPDAVAMIVREKNAVEFTFEDGDRPYRHVDVLLTQELSYSKLSSQTETVVVEGHPIPVLSIEKLIEVKERVSPPRPRDAFDIQELRRIQDRGR